MRSASSSTWRGRRIALRRCIATTLIDRRRVNNTTKHTHTPNTRALGRHLRARRLCTLLHTSAHLDLQASSVPLSGDFEFPSVVCPTTRFASPKPASNITTANHHITPEQHIHIIKMEYNTGAPAQGMTGGRACYNCESHTLTRFRPPRNVARMLLLARCRVCVGHYTRVFRVAVDMRTSHGIKQCDRIAYRSRNITDMYIHRRRPLPPGPRVPLQGYPHLLQLWQPGSPFPRVH